MITETIYNIEWSEPFGWDDAIKRHKSHHVLYQIYGMHHLYGSDVLLYIGYTLRGTARLKEHEKEWINEDYDIVKVRLGSLRKFAGWEEQVKNKGFIKDEKLIKRIEALLILAHQPACNTLNKNDAPKSEGIRIFNSGKSGRLFPELSYKYYDY
jgi:hypothetical protein